MIDLIWMTAFAVVIFLILLTAIYLMCKWLDRRNHYFD